MLEELKDIYDIHIWLRYVTWLGLLVVAVFLLWIPGGFPPQAWLLFFQMLIQLPSLWGMRGPAILLPLFVLLFLSLLWLTGWVAWIWICLSLIRYHRQQIVDKVRQSRIRWLSTQAMRREGLRFSQLVGGEVLYSDTSSHSDERGTLAASAAFLKVNKYDSSATPPKLRLPQRQPLLQSVTLSSLATLEERKPAGALLSASKPLSAYQTSSTHTPSGLLVPGGSLSGQPLEVGIGWHAGIHRQHAPNEDSVMALQNICTHRGRLVPFSLLVVADGMGGHARGLEASQIAVQMMMHTVLQNIMVSSEASDEFFSDMLVGGVDWANRAIYQQGRRLGRTMGTTVTAALVVGMKAYIANVGDSRTYLYREGVGLRQITRDHSVVATLVAFGEISSDEVYTHPERNKVYRSVGSDEYVDVDCFTVDLCQRDVLLLCSDGLWEMMRDPIIARILQHYQDLARASDALVEAALRGGGVDNVSVIAARVP